MLLHFIYFVLVGSLIVIYTITFLRLIRFSRTVTPLLGWLIGISYFILLPLLVLVVNNGYVLPAHYGAKGVWREVDLSNNEYLYPFMIIWSSLLFTAFAAYAITTRAAIRASALGWWISVRKLRRVIVVCALIMLVQWAVQISAAGGVTDFVFENWYTRYDEVLKRVGNLFVLYEYFALALAAVFTAAMAVLIEVILKEHTRHYRLLLFGAVIELLNMVVTGNRIFIALILLYGFIAVILHKRARLIWVGLFALPILAIAFNLWAQVRGDLRGIVNGYYPAISSQSHSPTVMLMNVTEGGDTMLLLHVIKDYGERYGFLNGATYAKVFTFFIPRRIYPEKVQNFALIAAKEYEPGINTSLNSTVLGEMYANFGIFTLILMPMFTLAIAAVSRWAIRRRHRHSLFGVVLFLFTVWFTRSVFSDSVLLAACSFVLIWLLRFERRLVFPIAGGAPLGPSLLERRSVANRSENCEPTGSRTSS